MVLQCGTKDKSDVLVTLEATSGGGIELEIESRVKKLFGKQIEKTVYEVLNEAGIHNAKVHLEDMGALDFVIRARLKTAIRALGKPEGAL